MSAAFTEYTDGQLVAGVLAGDRQAFAAVYDRYADRLHDFCWSVLRDRDEAADAVQDTFLLVAQRLAQLNDPERLRPWLYAIARSVALRRVRARRRVVLDEVEDMADSDPGPHRAAEQQDLQNLVWTAAAGLSERDRALLDLHVRQGLDGAELGAAMGVSTSHAYVLLTRLRDQVERSLGALLVARLGRADCAELDGVLTGWDGRFSPLMRKRVARHVDACAVCGDRRRIMVSPFALLAAVPLVPAPLYLRDRVLDQVRLVAHETALSGVTPVAAAAPVVATLPPGPPGPPGTPGTSAAGKRLKVLAAAAAVLALLIAGTALGHLRTDPVPGEPLALDGPAGLTTPAPPSAPGSAAPPSSSAAPPPPTSARPATTTAEEGPVADPPPPADPPETTEPPGPPEPPADTTPPVVGGVTVAEQLIYLSGCWEPTTTPVVAAVTDDVGVASVSLTWSGAGTGSQAMSGGGSQWSGVLGPVANLGNVTWTVTATDAAGNTSAPVSGSVFVTYCLG